MAKKLRTRRHAVVLNRSVGGDTVITVALVVLGIFMFLPMYYTVIQAFKPLQETYIIPPKFYVIKPTLKNFQDLFTNMNTTWVPISRYIFNTVFISVAATTGSVILGSLTAYALSKIRMPGAEIMFKIIVWSLMISSTVTGVVNFIIYVALGWINTYTISIVPTWASTLGLYLMKQFIDNGISDQVIESARLEGCSEFGIFLRIAMPLVKPAWLTLIVTQFQSVWNAGASAYVFSEDLKTFNSAVNTIMAASSGAGTAATVLMMSVPILVFVVNQSKIVETMATSGMKD